MRVPRLRRLETTDSEGLDFTKALKPFLLFTMSLRKSKIPYDKDEYFIDKENNVMWLRGSLSRSWARKHMSEQYGYEIKLATQSYIDELNK